MKKRSNDLKKLPFDQYSRQYVVSKMINNAIRRKLESLKIIDLGGHKGKTVEFQLDDHVTVLDVFEESYDGYIKGDAVKTGFPNNSFDIACSFDVLEHIPRVKRKNFLEESLRISKFGVFVTVPIDVDKQVSCAEIRLNKMYKSMFDKDHIWLKEHIDYVIPNVDEVESLIKNTGSQYVSIPSNRIGDWQLMQSLLFAASNNEGIASSIEDINRWYNTNLDNIETGVDVGYRNIYFISKDTNAVKNVRKYINRFKKSTIDNKTIQINEGVFDEFIKTFGLIAKNHNDLHSMRKNRETPDYLAWQNKHLKKQLAQEQKNNVVNAAELELVKGSISWRVTVPLRKFSGAIKKRIN